jgi:hypothetical protein
MNRRTRYISMAVLAIAATTGLSLPASAATIGSQAASQASAFPCLPGYGAPWYCSLAQSLVGRATAVDPCPPGYVFSYRTESCVPSEGSIVVTVRG